MAPADCESAEWVRTLDYVLEHLTPNGRAAVVVPEGIHFVSQSGHTQLRRILIQKGLLVADITLPHGVFKPYASVKTHILVINSTIARKSKSVLFIEIENDGFTQSDTRDPVAGSQLLSALKSFKSFNEAVLADKPWINEDRRLRAYCVAKSALLATAEVHLVGRWHDLPNRVIHRPNVPLRRIGDLCDVKDGQSPNMATVPGDYVMVVPAEERKTANHWDFEGKAVCIPLVSSAGHGKADIKRLHFQEGRFALASTMCALFVKDEEEIRPRYLYIFLSAMCDELLVPLMCGATNVTMSSSQLLDVLIPVPHPEKQDEVIESHLIATKAAELIAAASALRDSSDRSVTKLAEHVIAEAGELLQKAAKRNQVSDFIPSDTPSFDRNQGRLIPNSFAEKIHVAAH